MNNTDKILVLIKGKCRLCKHSMSDEIILCGYCRECCANTVRKMNLYYVDNTENVV